MAQIGGAREGRFRTRAGCACPLVLEWRRWQFRPDRLNSVRGSCQWLYRNAHSPRTICRWIVGFSIGRPNWVDALERATPGYRSNLAFLEDSRSRIGQDATHSRPRSGCWLGSMAGGMWSPGLPRGY